MKFGEMDTIEKIYTPVLYLLIVFAYLVKLECFTRDSLT